MFCLAAPQAQLWPELKYENGCTELLLHAAKSIPDPTQAACMQHLILNPVRHMGIDVQHEAGAPMNGKQVGDWGT